VSRLLPRSPVPRVVAARIASATELDIEFADGQRRRFDVRPLLDRGLFQALQDPECFSRVRVAFDTLAWPGNLALAPEMLYLQGVVLAGASAAGTPAPLAD
jgi:hypothetical protein